MLKKYLKKKWVDTDDKTFNLLGIASLQQIQAIYKRPGS